MLKYHGEYRLMQLGKDNHVKMVGKRMGKVKYKQKGEFKGIMSEKG
jgi:hypothetical protein